MRNSCLIAFIGLNFIGAVGVGKNARNMRSKSRVTKLFVASGAGALGEAVLACVGAREGAAASEAAMGERGGSVIDP